MEAMKMRLKLFIKTFIVRFMTSNEAIFSISVEQQKKYLEKFHAPNNDIDRSFYQYKCQMKLLGKLKEVVLNLISLFGLPLILIFLVNRQRKSELESKDAIVYLDGKPSNIIPDELRLNNGNMICIKGEFPYYLTGVDLKYIKKLFIQYPLSLFFISKNIIKISKYRYGIDMYNPKSIIVCAEYSFTSSILTNYCEFLNIKHINIMHGEKLFYMRDSFFRFHQCYVWDKYYLNLFKELKAETKQFIICKPRSMKFQVESSYEKDIDYTYYLGNESDEVLKKISDLLKDISSEKVLVSVRPHPRYSNINKINHLFNGIVIENNKEITIEESLARTKNAISLYSTVLNQAYHNGINIIIDDLSNPNHFKKLSELKYINLSRKYTLLSEILKKRDE